MIPTHSGTVLTIGVNQPRRKRLVSVGLVASFNSIELCINSANAIQQEGHQRRPAESAMTPHSYDLTDQINVAYEARPPVSVMACTSGQRRKCRMCVPLRCEFNSETSGSEGELQIVTGCTLTTYLPLTTQQLSDCCC